jgi:release factor glutamine methyltransferase
MSKIYQPAEDSFLLSEVIFDYIANLKNKEIKFLDMGAGSGVQAEAAVKAGIKKENITLADINLEAIDFLKKKGFNAIHSDLFSIIKSKFDVIVFNPPYLPEDKYDKEKDTTGGKKGYETLLKFFKEAKKHLNEDGVIFVLLSSFTKPEILKRKIKEDYEIKVVAERNLFFEKLFVWEVKPKIKTKI